MSARFERFEDLEKLARQAKYSVSGMADLLGYSVRQLERDYTPILGRTLRDWLLQLRLADGLNLIKHGANVSEAALATSYNHPQNFARAINKRFGCTASEHLQEPASRNTDY
jgi:AraC-like DNA-binding protein